MYPVTPIPAGNPLKGPLRFSVYRRTSAAPLRLPAGPPLRCSVYPPDLSSAAPSTHRTSVPPLRLPAGPQFRCSVYPPDLKSAAPSTRRTSNPLLRLTAGPPRRHSGYPPDLSSAAPSTRRTSVPLLRLTAGPPLRHSGYPPDLSSAAPSSVPLSASEHRAIFRVLKRAVFNSLQRELSNHQFTSFQEQVNAYVSRLAILQQVSGPSTTLALILDFSFFPLPVLTTTTPVARGRTTIPSTIGLGNLSSSDEDIPSPQPSNPPTPPFDRNTTSPIDMADQDSHDAVFNANMFRLRDLQKKKTNNVSPPSTGHVGDAAKYHLTFYMVDCFIDELKTMQTSISYLRTGCYKLFSEPDRSP
ncbi:unnamed protein product [Allacma fusca]|uniref:Uncharacterized protein n=1 Tax=Allacma fusca TaxID=39272 RepID=A0A8J2P8Q7_9HEXA|nr:unnamed protein product [Allacma fusca]